jgi:uncharacterized membrane protein
MRQRTRSWFENWTDSGSSSSLGVLGSVVAVLVSSLTSFVGYQLLPAEMQIHWTLGAGQYYGPEFAPTAVVLTAFPVLVGVVALGANWLAGKLPQEPEAARDRLAYIVSVVGTIAVLLGVQVGLVVGNL